MPGRLKRTLPTPVLAVSVAEAAKAMGLSRGLDLPTGERRAASDQKGRLAQHRPDQRHARRAGEAADHGC